MKLSDVRDKKAEEYFNFNYDNYADTDSFKAGFDSAMSLKCADCVHAIEVCPEGLFFSCLKLNAISIEYDFGCKHWEGK